MARIEEAYPAHSQSINNRGNTTSAEIGYIVFDVASEDEALQAVLAFTPSRLNGIGLDNISIDERLDETTFSIKASYSSSSSASGGDDGEQEEEPTMSFDCGGGSMLVTQTLKNAREIFNNTAGKNKKNPGNLVGWNGKYGGDSQINGVTIPVAQFRETYTQKIRLDKLTTRFKRQIGSLVGKVNSKAFKGWNAGEVMFMGASFSAPVQNDPGETITVTFNFEIRVNETNYVFKEGIQPVSKKGWEYAWGWSKAAKGDKDIKVDFEAAYISQVCQYADFSVLGL